MRHSRALEALIFGTFVLGAVLARLRMQTRTEIDCGPRRVGPALWLAACATTVSEWQQFQSAEGMRTWAEDHGGAFAFALDRGVMEWQRGVHVREPTAVGVHADPHAPATQLTVDEAQRYCRARGGRLPSFAELEGLRARVSAGAMNVWQGDFPARNTLSDRYLFASPVGAYPANELGLYDFFGNVWQWTTTQSDAGHYRIFGGSFLCDAHFCNGPRSRVQTAVGNEPAMHIGFRCAWDHPAIREKR